MLAQVLQIAAFHSGKADPLLRTVAYHLENNACRIRHSLDHSGNADRLIQLRTSYSGNAGHMIQCSLSRYRNAPFPKWNLWCWTALKREIHRAMNVSCIRAGVKDLSSADLIAKSKYIEERMADNPHFPDPSPEIALITTAREELEYWAIRMLDGSRQSIAMRWVRHAELEKLLVQLSKYVNSAAHGDVLRQLTSGFEQRRPPMLLGELPAPEMFMVMLSAYEGAVKAQWKRVHGARMYQVLVNATGPENRADWKPLGLCSRTRADFRGLEPGRLYWFCVQALGAAGAGPMSGVVASRAS